MLKVLDLKRSYRLSRDTVEQALKGVSFKLKAGEFVAIFGPSGCGKSTLLNALGGLDSGYEGSVQFNGQNLRQLSKAKLAEYRRDNVGFVFQNFNLIPHMNILENVMSAANLNGDSSKQKKEAAMNALRVVDLGTYANKKPNQLSGGQRQRVAIARALVNNPDIIIADEPTGALDTKTSDDILKFLRSLADGGKLVIVVTHNKEVADYGTRVIQMRDGEIESDTYTSKFEGITKQSEEKKKSRFGIGKTFKFAFKNFMQRKGRNILVGLGTSIGIIGIILALSLGNGITKEVNGIVSNEGEPRDLSVVKRDPVTRATVSTGVSQQDFAKVKKEIGEDKILSTTDVHYFPFTSYELDGQKSEVGKMPITNSLKDISYKTYLTSKTFVKHGAVQENNNEEGIWITEDLIQNITHKQSDEINYNDYVGKKISVKITHKIGDEDIQLETTEVIRGVLKNTGVTSLPITLSYTSMQKMLTANNAKAKINPYRYSLIVNSASYAEEVAKKYENDKEFSITTMQSALSQINQIVSIIQTILSFVAALSIVVAMVMIGIVLYISVIERTREIGTLKAIGYKSGSILQIFLFEAVLIAVVANVVAIIIAYGLSLVINQVIANAIKINNAILIYPSILAIILVCSALAAMVSGLYPAIKASRQDPATALRYE